MCPDGWHLAKDLDDFLDRTGDFLRSRPALHTMPLTAMAGGGPFQYGWVR